MKRTKRPCATETIDLPRALTEARLAEVKGGTAGAAPDEYINHIGTGQPSPVDTLSAVTPTSAMRVELELEPLRKVGNPLAVLFERAAPEAR